MSSFAIYARRRPETDATPARILDGVTVASTPSDLKPEGRDVADAASEIPAAIVKGGEMPDE